MDRDISDATAAPVAEDAPAPSEPQSPTAPAPDRPWLAGYPDGVPAEIDPSQYASVADLLERSFQQYADRIAYISMGRALTYAELDRASRDFAAYLQSMGLRKGDRVAVMLPNLLQSPIAVAGVLRAGLVVVNVNPLYKPRELRHQLRDAGAKAIVVLETMANTFAEIAAETPVEFVILSRVGDMLGAVKGAIVNAVVRYAKRKVPPYSLPHAVPFREALRLGAERRFRRPETTSEDLAVLQYTGGTTGAAKGAMLSHRALVASLLSAEAWMAPVFRDRPIEGQPTALCALPLYHVFAFVNCGLLSARLGGCAVLIPDARELPDVIDAFRRHRIHMFPGVNTLFAKLLHEKHAARMAKADFSELRMVIGGGMAVSPTTAKAWMERAGCPIAEGYGLTETSSGVCCNPLNTDAYSGAIGLPMPSVEVRILDEQGAEVPHGTEGEIAIRGPQLMDGYWRAPEETAKVMTADGFLRTGDIGAMDDGGAVAFLGRTKDVIIVSGLNVYPKEIEEVVKEIDGVEEAGAIGVPDEERGERIRLYLEADELSVPRDKVLAHCRAQLADYKRPTEILYRETVPLVGPGKVDHKLLRAEAAEERAAAEV